MVKLPDLKKEKKLWKKGYGLVIGVDEVGRGAFAGPVVASAVAFARGPVRRFPRPMSSVDKLPAGTRRGSPTPATPRIDDSKRLKPHERRLAAVWVKKHCLAYGIGEVGVRMINRLGIGKATEMAMRKAIAEVIEKLRDKDTKILSDKKKKSPNISISQYLNIFLLVDAFHIKYLRGIGLKNQKAIKKGDQKSISIAAASILAKVYRDNLMQKLTKRYKKYHWGKNKGYGTKKHQEAILKNGSTTLHRKKFVETFLRNKSYATIS